MRIDAHLHFWRPSCGFDNRPVADHAAYRRDFLPEHVAPDLAAGGIDGAILVQTCPQVAETQWLLALCADDERILGVTAWVDLAVPGCDYGPLLAQPKVVGVRAQLRRIADASFVTQPAVVANLAAALRAELNVTVLAEARHYGPVQDALARLPDGPVTINHLGLPFPDVDRATWRSAMRALARRPQTYVQLSGLPFLYGDRWREADAQSVLDDALDILGPGRLMFASDWPMMLRFATYADWVGAVEAFCDRQQLAPGDRDAIFAGNVRQATPRLARLQRAGA
jgi:L-fuconolactonase